jgi:hypothetical protein
MTGGVEEYAERLGRILQEGWFTRSLKGDPADSEGTAPIHLSKRFCIFDAKAASAHLPGGVPPKELSLLCIPAGYGN